MQIHRDPWDGHRSVWFTVRVDRGVFGPLVLRAAQRLGVGRFWSEDRQGSLYGLATEASYARWGRINVKMVRTDRS